VGAGDGLRHGVFLPPFDDLADPAAVLEVARLAEDRGWDGVFLWDHVQRPEVRPVADPWILLAAVAVSTERVLLGPMVTPLARRRPQKLAREVVTLDHLSGGRVVLGLGLGVDSGRELSAFGELVDPAERGDLLDEGLGLLDGLLSGEVVHHRGRRFTADGVQFLPRPLRPDGVPVWMAARTQARRPLRRAATRQGLFAIEMDPEGLAAALAVVSAERGGLDGFDVAALALPGLDPGAFAAAGATWWMSGPYEGEPLEDVLELVGEGPPR